MGCNPDVSVMDMEQTGREFLRAELKAKGEADTVEDMLRVGFHWPPLVTVNHLHMHLLYPISEVITRYNSGQSLDGKCAKPSFHVFSAAF